MDKPLTIKEVRVSKLFNVFDHAIPLSPEEPITIIIGPNGFGKTVLLRMIEGLLSAKYRIFYEVPFQSFEIIFTSGEILKLTPEAEAESNQKTLFEPLGYYGIRQEKPIKLHIEYKENKRAKHSKSRFYTRENIDVEKMPVHRRWPIQMIEEFTPELRQVGPGTWQHMPSGEVMRLQEVINRFSDILPSRMLSELQVKSEPEWLKDIRQKVQVRLIKADRLSVMKVNDDSYKADLKHIATVKEYSDETVATIRTRLAEYAERSQVLDRTFPERIFKRGGEQEYTKDQLAKKLEELENKRFLLREAGLLDDKDIDIDISLPRDVDESQLSLLTVYISDVGEKLGIFDDLAKRIELFTAILNKRFSYKRLTIRRDRGFAFTTDKGTPLSPLNLSSGEQHELVLLYELLFKVEEDSIILIDEPELSLHVAWQMEFLKDLQEITALNKTKVLIATHSPEIINDRWDLTVELSGPA